MTWRYFELWGNSWYATRGLLLCGPLAVNAEKIPAGNFGLLLNGLSALRVAKGGNLALIQEETPGVVIYGHNDYPEYIYRLGADIVRTAFSAYPQGYLRVENPNRNVLLISPGAGLKNGITGVIRPLVWSG